MQKARLGHRSKGGPCKDGSLAARAIASSAGTELASVRTNAGQLRMRRKATCLCLEMPGSANYATALTRIDHSRL